MDVLGALLTVAVAGFFLGAALSIVQTRFGYATCFVASAILFAVAAGCLLGGAVQGFTWSGPIGGAESLRLDGLSGFFALATALVWMATSAYSVFYDDRPSPLLAICYSLTLGSIAVLVTASSFLLFLVAWETMTLASYGMILQAHGRSSRVFSAAFVFLAFGEASTLLVILAVAGLRYGVGTFGEVPYLAAGTLSTIIFLGALFGFALKMGVAPFHMSEWLPIAHSSAPSNASAVLSSTLTLAGVYGLFRVLSLLGPPPLWWGAVVLGMGAISVLLGALFAAVSEHTKGLPAYSTVENNGLILVALGIALLAHAEGLDGLYVFALFAAFYQALAHAVAKTVLFLSAGWVERSAHTFDLSAVGGAVKDTDRSAYLGTLIATLSLAAAPPIAGFVSEWMILEALFQSYQFAPAWTQFVGLLAGAAVALAAGLIVIAMVKFFGFAVLWRPRQPVSAARAAPGLAGPIGAIGLVTLALGIGAPWVIAFLAPTVGTFTGQTAVAPIGGLLDVPNGWSILSGSPFGILSPPMVPIGLALGAVVGAGYYLLGRGKSPGTRRVEVWMAGNAPGEEGETYTSFGYSTGLRIMMGSILRTREVRASTGFGSEAGIATPVPYSVDLEVLDIFKLVYDALARGGDALSAFLKARLMTGHLGRYLSYLLVVVLFVVIYIAVIFG